MGFLGGKVGNFFKKTFTGQNKVGNVLEVGLEIAPIPNFVKNARERDLLKRLDDKGIDVNEVIGQVYSKHPEKATIAITALVALDIILKVTGVTDAIVTLQIVAMFIGN